MSETFHLRFDRLKDAHEEALLAFFSDPALLVKGTDSREWGDFRGGCVPLLIIGAALTALPMLLQWELNTYAVVFVVTGWMGWATSQLIRTAIANRRSRKLNGKQIAWHGIGWTDQRLAYRSWSDCLLVDWEDVSELRYLDDRWGKGLSDTLWMHMVDGRRVQVVGRDGRFAGRPMIDWYADMSELLEAKTGRVSSRPAPVSR